MSIVYLTMSCEGFVNRCDFRAARSIFISACHSLFSACVRALTHFTNGGFIVTNIDGGAGCSCRVRRRRCKCCYDTRQGEGADARWSGAVIFIVMFRSLCCLCACVNRNERGSRRGNCSTSSVTLLCSDPCRFGHTSMRVHARLTSRKITKSHCFLCRVLNTSSLGSGGKRSCC